MAGKRDASMEEIRIFVQRSCQYAQLHPTNSSTQPFKQMRAPPTFQPSNITFHIA